MTDHFHVWFRSIRFRRALRVLLGASVLGGAGECASQTSSSSFGPYTEHVLSAAPEAMAVACGGVLRCPEIVVAPRGEPVLHFYVLTDSATLTQTRQFPLSLPQSVIETDDLDGDGSPDFAALSADGDVLTIVKRHEEALTQTTIPLRVRAKKITIADVNNDGMKDILLFGKSMTGVVTVLGRPKGEFERGPGLFSEFSAGDVRVTDVNGDGVADVVLLSWLTNQLILYFGIGEDVYSEHVVLDLPSEPSDLSLAPLDGGREVLLSVTLPERREVHIYSINAAGEFRIRHTVRCPGRPAGATLADVNNDGLPDLVSATVDGVLVALAQSRSSFGKEMVFGVTASDPVWLVTDLDGDTKNDLVLAERTGDLMIIVGNAESGGSIEWPGTYIVGGEPRGLVVADFNSDGEMDVAVANALSSSVSVLMNRGKGRLRGQQPVNVPEIPIRLTAVGAPSGSEQMLLSEHPASDKIAVIRMTEGVPGSALYVIETGPHPHILHAELDPVNTFLNLLVRTSEDRVASVSVSLFEQISGDRFLESRYRAALPNRVKALAVGDFTGDRKHDLVVVSGEPSSSSSTLSLALAERGYDYSDVHSLFDLEDSSFVVREIYPVDLDQDECLDVVLVGGPARPKLGIAFGSCDGGFRSGIDWISGVYPVEGIDVIVKDVNRDRLVDLVFLDGIREAVVALYGRRGGRFDDPVRVAPGRGVNGLEVGNIRGPQASDLVLSYGRRGVVSVIYSPFTR
ncbi:MAG: VCBS repeat-containing protein [Bacteroidota bacterium]